MKRFLVPAVLGLLVFCSPTVFSLPQVTDPLSSLQDSDPHVRRSAINQIVIGRLTGDLKPVREALADPDPLVRESAAWALGLLQDPLGASVLIQRYPEEKGLLPKAAIVTALGELRTPHSGEILQQAFRERSPLLVRPAALGLGLLDDWKVAQVLLERARDPSASIRAAVALALSSYKEPEAKEALSVLAKDPVALVKEKAVFGIKLQSEEKVFIETAAKGLVSSDVPTRRVSARALGLWGHGETAKVLLKNNVDHDEDLSVRVEAGQALARISAEEEAARLAAEREKAAKEKAAKEKAALEKKKAAAKKHKKPAKNKSPN